MGLVLETLLEVLRRPRPTMVSVLAELLLFLGPLWVAVLVGLVVGWAWKPKWVNLGRGKSGVSFSSSSLPALLSDGFGFGCIPSFSSLKAQLPAFVTGVWHESGALSSCPSLGSMEKDKLAVTGEDLNYICQLVEVKDGGPSWIPMMDRSTASMSYQAWRRDPETGPPQYRSRTVYEDATPELVRDFFWDDEFRAKWDDMLLFSSTLEECHDTGTMVVQWVRKFPFFCSDREYIIGRRIWQSGQSYYCVTKGVPCSSIPRRNKPRRVDLYYSSWCIRAVESRKGDGQLTACEVLLFHYEDMGIPWEIAKLGVRQGMWGAVKKIEPGLRAYQMARKSGVPLSPSASLAQINSQVNPNYLRSVETANGESSEETLKLAEKQLRKNIPRLLIVGGAVVLACSLDRGLLTKAVIFGVARRFGMFGRRL